MLTLTQEPETFIKADDKQDPGDELHSVGGYD